VPFYRFPFCLQFTMMEPGFICYYQSRNKRPLPQLEHLPQTQKKWIFSQFCIQLQASKQPISHIPSNTEISNNVTLTSFLTDKLSVSWWVRMCQSLQMMSSAYCSTSGLISLTEQPERGRSWGSALPVSETVTLLPSNQWYFC
jgi:hypothetical protein